MNKIIKIFIVTLIILIILSSSIFAKNADDFSVKEIFKQADDWTNDGSKHVNTTMNTDDLNKYSSIIYNILLGVGTAIAIIVGAILGIQFMTAGIDQKVEVKKAILPYIISCIVIFGSLGIWKLVVRILGSI